MASLFFGGPSSIFFRDEFAFVELGFADLPPVLVPGDPFPVLPVGFIKTVLLLDAVFVVAGHFAVGVTILIKPFD